MRKLSPGVLLLVVPVVCLLTFLAASFVYFIPPVHERLAWRVESLQTRLKYFLHPPEQVVFVPQEAVDPAAVNRIVQETLQVAQPTVTPSPLPATPVLARPGPSSTPLPSPTPTLVPTPLPEKVVLSGITHEYQQMNNCGPTTLAMALTFWKWQGDQRDTRLFLRPNFKTVDDKNVMPEEMVKYVTSQTPLKALVRVGGDIDTLKRLIAAGFPVVIEKGLQQHPKDWMGHYAVLNGYDNARQRFVSQDSFIMADLPVPYSELAGQWWRDFNYVYLVVYPPEREAEVLAILGPQADVKYNRQFAAQKAQDEISGLSGRDLYFAWYNLGSSLVALQDYAGAAAAYDQAFALYPTIPEDDRPWRMLWYQTGPYAAYYYTGRFEDVINLGNQTLDLVGKPILEETFYWLGLAREAQGDLEKAIYDYKTAVEINPTSTAASQELLRLGIQIP